MSPSGSVPLPPKDKVSDSSHTRLSLSMAQLSNYFWLLRKFLTLCMLVVAHAAFCKSWKFQFLQKVV